MYVCLCKGVTDRHIREQVEARGGSFREVRRELGLGSQCGACTKAAKQVYRQANEELKILQDLAYPV